MFTCRSDEDIDGDKADSIILFDPNKGEFSQWYPTPCTLDGITFNCAEQLMMYAKASMWHTLIIIEYKIYLSIYLHFCDQIFFAFMNFTIITNNFVFKFSW